MISKQQFLVGLLGWSHSALALPKAASSPSVSLAGPSLVNHPTSEPHTPYSGTPTTTGVVVASSVGSSVPSKGIAPGATDYPSDGKLHSPQPAPFVPAGGVGTSGETPVYNAKSDFDFESLVCILHLLWKTVSNCSGFGCLPRIHRTRPLPRRTCSILCLRLRKGRSHR